MSTTDTLTSTIPPQRQTTTATDGFPTVLMDDTGYTMDDPRAYMDNLTVNSEGLQGSVAAETSSVVIHNPSF